jgi:hypothetical protein
VEEIKKHHRKLTLLAAAAMMFLLLLAGIYHSTPLGGQLAEHLHSGVTLSDPVLVGESSESTSDLIQSSTSSFLLPALQLQSRTSSFFFRQSGKRLQLTAAVSPRGPPVYS